MISSSRPAAATSTYGNGCVGSATLPIPNTPTLAGTLLYGQHLVIDANGPFLGFATLSNGLSM